MCVKHALFSRTTKPCVQHCLQCIHYKCLRHFPLITLCCCAAFCYLLLSILAGNATKVLAHIHIHILLVVSLSAHDHGLAPLRQCTRTRCISARRYRTGKRQELHVQCSLFFWLPHTAYVACGKWALVYECNGYGASAMLQHMQGYVYVFMNASLDLPLNATTSGLNWYPVLYHWITAGILMPVCLCVYIVCVGILMLSCCQHFCLGSWPSGRQVGHSARPVLASACCTYLHMEW